MEKLGVDGLRWIYGAATSARAKPSLSTSPSRSRRRDTHDWIGFPGKAPKDFAAGAPRECVALSLVQFDVWGLWQSVWKFVGEMDEAGAQNARAQMEGGLSQFGADDLEKSFLSQIDGKFLSFNVPIPEDEWKAQLPAAFQESASSGSGAAGHQGTGMVLGLRDVPSVSRFVEGVLKAVGAFDSVKTEEFQGNQIHRFSAGGCNGFSWAYLKQGAAFSQSPSALRAALRMEARRRRTPRSRRILQALRRTGTQPAQPRHHGGIAEGRSLDRGDARGRRNGRDDGRPGFGQPARAPAVLGHDRPPLRATTASTISRSGGVLLPRVRAVTRHAAAARGRPARPGSAGRLNAARLSADRAGFDLLRERLRDLRLSGRGEVPVVAVEVGLLDSLGLRLRERAAVREDQAFTQRSPRSLACTRDGSVRLRGSPARLDGSTRSSVRAHLVSEREVAASKSSSDTRRRPFQSISPCAPGATARSSAP